MANSYVRYTGTGAQENFSLSFQYLDRAHISVKVNGSPVSFSWVNATTVSVTPAPANGAVVELRRTTPASEPNVDFQDGAIVTEEQLDQNALQSLYATAEAQDGIGDALSISSDNVFDARDKRIKNVDDPTSAQDAATKAYVDASTGEGAAEAAEAALASLQSLYLGPLPSDPASGTEGQTYFNTTSNIMRVRSDGAWINTVVSTSNFYTKTEVDAAIAASEDDASELYGALGDANAWVGTNNFFGEVTVPTKSANDNSFAAASTQYVDRMWTTGDIKFTWKTTADAGWIMHTDGSIGSASSGATYANAAAQALFLLIWTNFSNTEAPVNGGRGASAAADWAANKRISLPKALGRTIGVAGAGSGLTSRTLGAAVGAETVAAEMPAHTHSAKRIIATVEVTETVGGTFVVPLSSGFDNGGVTGSASSGDGTMSVVQPSAFWNVMIKL